MDIWTEWCAQSTSQACTDVDSQLGGFTDADVKADLPPTDADHDDNNDVSNCLLVTHICIFHLLEDTLDGQAH